MAMAIVTLFGLGAFEFLLWLVIFVIYAWIIARRAPGKYFLHGFIVSLVNSIWITAIHFAFFSTYVTNNPQMVEGAPPRMNPRIIMIIAGPIVGAVMGVLAGFFALLMSKIVKGD
jgi:uncharacterized membrane protein